MEAGWGEFGAMGPAVGRGADGGDDIIIIVGSLLEGQRTTEREREIYIIILV